MVLVPILAGTKGLGKFRAGLLGMLALATMLVGDLANTFLYWNHLGMSKTAKDRARVMVAGAIISSIALYVIILLAGVVDEKGEKRENTGEPAGETYGGRYIPKPGTGAGASPTSVLPYGVETPPSRGSRGY